MASSMTGFGRSEASNENAKIIVEIRSVNHRYLDLNIKINRALLVFENKVRQAIQNGIKRGKVDVSISYQPQAGAGEDILYNEALANMYVNRINKIANDFNLVNDLTATRLANMRDVLTVEESDIDEDVLWTLLSGSLNEAIDALKSARLSEGERLKADLNDKLSMLHSLVLEIERVSPMIIEEYKKRLAEKVEGLLEDSEKESSRIAMEVVLFADKICVDEELVRLKSHIDGFKNTLNAQGESGRKLDFIAQEMNREANTILSKTTDPGISDTGIEIKTLIEKIREQIQNIE